MTQGIKQGKGRWLPGVMTLIVVMGDLTVGASPVSAHGGLAHVQVTAWAVENLPQGELRQFLAHPETFNSILLGAAYPDVGYYPGLEDHDLHRAYGEYSHWTPFLTEFVKWIKTNDPPPWTSLESRKRVAFLLGCAAHGFQDEVFDSLFLPMVDHHDGEGQDAVDPATDGLLVRDGYMGMYPTLEAPLEALAEVFNGSGLFRAPITPEMLSTSLENMGLFYLDEGAGPALASIALASFENVLLWTADHYMDPVIPGSLHSEVFPTGWMIQAMWEELKGAPSEKMVVFQYPEEGRRLGSGQAGNPASWVSLLFSTGVDLDDIEVRWSHSSGVDVPFSRNKTDWARVLMLVPSADLIPGDIYSISLKGNVTTVSGGLQTLERSISIQVECDKPDDARCSAADEVPVARLDGADSFRKEWGQVESSDEKGCGGCSGVGQGGVWSLLLLVLLVTRRRQGAWF